MYSIIFLFILIANPVNGTEAKIWTDRTSYVPGDYVKVNIQLPKEYFSSCEDYLIDPSGNERRISEGGCGAGLTENSIAGI